MTELPIRNHLDVMMQVIVKIGVKFLGDAVETEVLFELSNPMINYASGFKLCLVCGQGYYFDCPDSPAEKVVKMMK